MMEAHIPRIPSIQSRKDVQSDAEIVTALITDVAQINLLAYTFGKRTYTEEQINAIRGTYDAAVRDLDRITHDLLTDLEARGELDNTIVVLTSDHGENLADHGMFGHKFGVWNTLAHVPLVIWYPEHIKPGRVTFPVTNLDLFHTLIKLAGLEPPDTDPDGTGDLLEQIRALPVFTHLNETTPVSINRIDKLYGVNNMDAWFRTYAAVEDKGWKFIEISDGTRQLYDLRTDLAEQHNVIDEHAAEAAQLQTLLDTYMDSLQPYDPALRTEADKTPEIAPSTKGMLEQLGYIDDDG
jgi:arylsulfatase A-like enzyme